MKKLKEILWSTYREICRKWVLQKPLWSKSKNDQKIIGPPVLLLNKHSTFFPSQCTKRQIFFLIYYQLGGSFKAASLSEVYLLITRGHTVLVSPPSFCSICLPQQSPIKSQGTAELRWRKLCILVLASNQIFEFQKFWSLIFTLM